MTTDARREEIAAGLAGVRRRIQPACADAGRDPSDIQLVVVTKHFPVSDVQILAELGVRDIGENRDQEAREKLTDPALDGVALTRHFVGQLQTNKAGSVVSYADVIHTVDRLRLVRALAKAADRAGRRPRVLVQVSLDQDPSPEAHEARRRGGAPVEQVAELADAVAEHPSLEIRGVMAVAPVDADPDEAFARLREVADGILASHPAATWVSAGMSDDIEAAIRHGATHLRVGRAILGSRPALR